MSDIENNIEEDGENTAGLEPGKVYFMREVDLLTKQEFPYYKIGKVLNEKDVNTRLKEHQTGNPRSIEIVAEVESKQVTRLETALHNLNAGVRIHSGEWFHFPTEVELNAAIADAQRLNAEVDANSTQTERAIELAKTASNGAKREADSEARDIAELLVSNNGASKILTGNAKNIANELRQREGDELFDRVGKITPGKPKSAFSSADLKKDNPELYAQFETQESFSKVFRPVGNISVGESNLLVVEYGFGHDLKHLATLSIAELHAEYLRLWALRATYDWTAENLANALRVATGEYEGIEGLVSWKRYNTFRFDSARFKAEMPDLYQQFVRESQGKETFKVFEWKSYSL